MKNKIIPSGLQGNYKDSLGEFSDILCGKFRVEDVNNREGCVIHFIKQNSCVLAFFKKDLNCSPLPNAMHLY